METPVIAVKSGDRDRQDLHYQIVADGMEYHCEPFQDLVDSTLSSPPVFDPQVLGPRDDVSCFNLLANGPGGVPLVSQAGGKLLGRRIYRASEWPPGDLSSDFIATSS